MTENITNKTNLQNVWEKIFSLDFTIQKSKMNEPAFEGWSLEKLDIVEQQYKRMWFLWYKYNPKLLPPSFDIDKFWHHHILDTEKYHKDSQQVFGYYRHHKAQSTKCSEEVNNLRNQYFEETLSLYQKELGEELYEIDEIVTE